MIQQWYRQLVIVPVLAVCLFYLAYRALFTLNFTTPYAISVSVFLFLGEFYGVFVLMLFFLQVWDSREPPQQPILEGRTVDVFVPTYNEDPQLLRATLEACTRLDYAHRTIVCDDGKRPAVAALAKDLGVDYMIRPDNRHAKAGNLNHAFEKTDGEFIIILDADHVPEPHFISRLIGYFRDEKLGFVQTPHAFYNFDNFQARLDHKNRRYWEEGHLFYEVIQPGRNRWNCPIFAGSAAMFRRAALKEVGYIAVETITEDMHTGMRVNSRGWKSLAISERLVAGQAAPDVTTFHSQRIRWGEGNLSIMAYDNPLTMRGLTLAQRFCYLGSMVHWAGGLFKLAIYLTPILMMFTGVPPVAEFTWTLAGITFLYLIASIFGVRVASNGFGSFINGELFCMINFYTQIRGTLRALFWRKFQKFVVTAKRGRQAKSIWPYIKPQVYLMALSVLAVFWGWYKVISGISDDYFKPIIPTFWISFHMLLAYMVVRRALWPEDRRFSTRHAVHLPVGYVAQGVDVDGNALTPPDKVRGLGISADLNEMGLGFVAYEPLPERSVVQVTIWGRGESVTCEGEIRWVKNVAPGSKRGSVAAQGYRYGVAFRNLGPEQTDALNRLTLHYAVPRLYSEYAEGRVRTLWHRLVTRLTRGIAQRRTAIRHETRLPVVVHPGRRPAVHTVTESVSRTALSALLPAPLEPGTEVDFVLPTPLGEVQGRARAVKGEPRRYAAKEYQLCVFEFLSFVDQGRTTLEMTINPRENPQLEPVLNPDRQPLYVPMAKPNGLGVVGALCLVVMSLGVFHLLHRDDIFLREIAWADRPITEAEIDRVESVFNATLQTSYPSNDRLVLLMAAMARLKRGQEMNQVTMLLAPRDRGNLDLQMALAQILDNTKDFSNAEQEYQRLLETLQDGGVPPTRKRDLLVAAARASVHAGNVERAGERFREVIKAYPRDLAVRNEFAGVLMAAGKFQEAADVFHGIEPDLSGRLLLVAIHAQAKDFAAAERECRTIIRLRPDDAQAKLLLADVLSWQKGGYRQSRAIYEQLAKMNGSSPDLVLRLAQIALWGNNYNEALERFQAIIDERLDNPEIVKGYVDAAASADQVGPPQRKTALAIYERTLTGPTDDPVFLTRLAWVLQRLDEQDKSTVLLDRAVALNPQNPALRKQLIGSLVASGRFSEKLLELQGKELDFETRQILLHTHLRQKNLDAATEDCRQLLKLRPGDLATQRLLADVLSWNRKYPEALELFGQLARAAPGDRELRVRLAEVTLWSGDHDKALDLYHELLQGDFDAKLWPPFTAAAASAKKYAERHVQMILRIYDGTGAADTKDAVFLARLAWTLQRLKETDRARVVLDRALALRPEEPAARKELAGVLAAAGYTRDALALYEGVPLELADRYQLAWLHAAEKNFPAAEKQCRAILKEQPDDKKAMRQLADVLSWKKDYKEALALFTKLTAADPADPELPVRLAEVTLWSGAYGEALTRYQKLLQTQYERPELWPGFVDAAASAPALTAESSRLLAQIAQRTLAADATDVALLTRLAWVMHRLHEPDRVRTFLDRALAQNPTEPILRKELAGVLAAAGRNKDALRLYEGIALELADRYCLAAVYAAEKDFAAAEAQCRAILAEKPEDLRARRQLADVLAWKKDYVSSLALLEKLAAENPKDRDVLRRLAEVALWSGAYDKAVPRFQALLAEDVDNRELWSGFVDACASAPQVGEEAGRLLRRLAERAAASEMDVTFLTRLSWALHRVNDAANVKRLLDRAMALNPRDPAARKELVAVLATAGRNKEALHLIEGLPPDLHDPFQIASLHAADKDFAAAETECRALLDKMPKDLRATRLLAGILTWKKDYLAAMTLLRKLAEADPTDSETATRLAEVTLWSGDHAKALTLLQTVLESKFEQPGVWRSFVDAAATLGSLTREQRELVVRISDHALKAKCKDVPFLARLAWVVYRAQEPAKAARLLDAAMALQPKDPGIRRELAGTLAAVGKFMDALRMYEGLTLDDDDRYHLVGVYATALLKVRDLLEDQPDDKELRKQIAYVGRWKQVVGESLARYEQLAHQAPADQRLKTRLADMTLWSGNFDKALAYFQQILDENFAQPKVWPSYIDAAASSTVTFTAAQRSLALRLYGERAVLESKVEYLSRLAWVLYRLKEFPRANQLLDRALALDPQEPAVRKELASMLGTVGKHQLARKLFDGLKLTLADRYRLAEIDIACKLYESAENQVRAILQDRPGDLRAQMLLAAILTGSKCFGEAARLYQELSAAHLDEPTIPVKLAELALWGGDYDGALVQFQKLLDKHIEQSSLWRGYVDAAASAKQLPDTLPQTASYLCREALKNPPEDAVYVTRLAWVLRRAKHLDGSTALLKLALARDPGNRTVRLQLAETLYENRAFAEAEEQYRLLLRPAAVPAKGR